ncbi:unnamed protein product [Sphenostylis stenocarpa]|uniref:Uncharacterized protein n=1 Tax=Sphenostylis stenocarpa TaxID=92480 RepID=A0AA86T524_9FABA|nr:unnamed protein product [Sphenostylis stenocarpa]
MSFSHYHSQMNGIQNMDGEFESDSLDMFIDWNDDNFQPTFLQSDWNDDNFQPTFLQSDSPHTAFQNTEETITELPAVPTPAVAESMVEITNLTSGSYQGSSSASALTFVPNPLQNPCVQGLIPNRTVDNNSNGIQMNQSFSHPGLVHPNPGQPRPGNEETHGFPSYNDISNSHAAESSRWPQSFTPVQNQIGHASELEQILDALSQPPMRPVYPMCPRLEPYSDLELGFVIMPTNPYHRGCRPVLPDPASSIANYGQQSSLFATTSNSFGSRSSVPPMSHGVPNQIMSANNTSSQALISRLLGHTSSRTQGTREAEIAPVLRNQPSEAIRRILNMNPTRTVTRNFPSITSEQGGSIPTARVRYEPPYSGRPPKRRDAEGSSSQRGKVSTGGTTGTSQRAQRPQGGVVIRDLSAVPNPPSAPRGKVNPLTPISDYSNHRQGIDVPHHPERSVKYKKFSRV